MPSPFICPQTPLSRRILLLSIGPLQPYAPFADVTARPASQSHYFYSAMPDSTRSCNPLDINDLLSLYFLQITRYKRFAW